MLRFTEAQLAEYQKRNNALAPAVVASETPTVRKYRNTPVEDKGVKFDSKHEWACYRELQLREKAGEIEGLRCQVKFSLFDAGGHCRGEHIATYRADFVYREAGKLVVADAKSEKTRRLRDWPRTKALLKACHGYEVVEL